MERVGRHTIVRELARAEVLATFEAKDDDGHAVRLRVVDDGLELGVDGTSFEDDLARVAALRHPGIDRPIAWSAEEPMHVSTLRVRGASLASVVEAAPSKRIAVDVAAGMGADIAEALDAAHAAGLVHAGLSLESILLGMDGRARLTDFGLMRWLNDRSSANAAVMRGSIESLAPEQLSAPESVGRHTDVFGLGLVLYRVLTGKHAFDAPSALGISIRLSMGKPTPIASHEVEIPETLSSLVMQMLATSPADRPAVDVVARTLTKHAGAFRPALGSLAAAAVAREEPAEEVAPDEDEDGASDAREESEADTESRLPTPAPPAPSEASSASREASPAPPLPPSPPGVWDGTTSVAFDPPTEPEMELPEQRNDYPTYVELRAPEDRGDVLHPPASGGDTSVWPADQPGFDVPKTVILEAPGARPSAPASAPRVPGFPPPLEPDEPIHAERSERPAWIAGAPEWAIWAAIALGAFALLVGTATLVILIAG